MASRLLLSLSAILLSLALCGVPAFVTASGCDKDVAVSEKGAMIIKTKNLTVPSKADINVFVKPSKEFYGVSLATGDQLGVDYVGFFPLEPNDQCLPQNGEWGEMMMKMQLHENNLTFRLSYGHCHKACVRNIRKYKDPLSLQNFTVYGYGTSYWRRNSPTGTKCNTTKIESSSSTPLKPSTCENSPLQAPNKTSTTNRPPTTAFSKTNTSSPSTSFRPPFTAFSKTNTSSPSTSFVTSTSSAPDTEYPEVDIDGLVVVVVTWVVGVVVMMTTPMVSGVVVWQIWRHGRAPTDVTKRGCQPV